MKKKILLFAIACITTLVHAQADTYDVTVGDLIYTVDTETLEACVARSTEISGDVVIPASIEGRRGGVTRTYAVTAIGDGAFSQRSALTSVTIPNSVTTIGEWVFQNCTSLESVTIPESVTNIGSRAFAFCNALTSVTIPNSVTSIGESAFVACPNMTNIEVASENSNYASSDGILYSKDMTILMQCPGAKTAVDIPNSVTTIGEWAFNCCLSLTSVTIPNSVTTIGEWAFENCTSLASVTIPNSVTTIGEWAFNNCTSLASVTIPESVTTIGDRAFLYCTSLASVTIPESVTNIGSGAFAVCNALTSVTIPNSVTSIGESAFTACSNLTNIEVASGNPNYVSSAGILYSKDMTVLMQCPGAKMSVEIPNSVTTIDYEAFCGCHALPSVTIPNTITSIGNNAFSECSSLATVTIPNTITTIGRNTFHNCTSLASVTIPNSVTSIGLGAFEGCTSLISVMIPESVTTIGQWAFGSCSSLTAIEVASENPNYASSDGFLCNKDMTILIQCPGAKTAADIPNSITTIDWYAFRDCIALVSVTIPESVTSMKEQAFDGCKNIEKIYCTWETPRTIYTSPWDPVNYTDATLYVPEGCLDAYQAISPWSWFSNIEEYKPTGVEETLATGDDAKTVVATYDINGKQVSPDTKGLVIVRYSDGTARKVFIRDQQ